MPNVLQCMAPIAVLEERIKWHCDPANTSGLLQGLKYFDMPTWRVEGDKDIPNLCIIDFTDTEAYGPGANAGPMPGRDNVTMFPVQKVLFLLICKKKYGLYADPNSGTRGLGDWVSFIRDAWDLNKDWQPDSILNNTCRQPFTSEVKGNDIDDQTWGAGIEVTLYPVDVKRGTRKDLMST